MGRLPHRIRAGLGKKFIAGPLPASASPEQGAKADTAVQPADLAPLEVAVGAASSSAGAAGALAAAAQAGADAAAAAAAAAQATANTGVANAAAAQGTANTALADAATAQAGVNAVPGLITAAMGRVSVLLQRENSGTNAGSRAAGINTVLVNTILYNGGGLSQDGRVPGAIFVPAGTWFIWGDLPGYRVNLHQALLFWSDDGTGGVYIAHGTSEWAPNDITAAPAAQTRSQFSCVVGFPSSSTLFLRHYCQTAQTTNGGGRAATPVDGAHTMYETYARIHFVRLA